MERLRTKGVSPSDRISERGGARREGEKERERETEREKKGRWRKEKKSENGMDMRFRQSGATAATLESKSAI